MFGLNATDYCFLTFVYVVSKFGKQSEEGGRSRVYLLARGYP